MPAAQRAEEGTSLDQIVAVETPEMVLVSYTIAGVGSRVVAGLTDLLICLVSSVTFWVAMVAFGRWLPGGRGIVPGLASAAWIVALLVLLQFAFLWGYYVLFEALRDGQTPGKKLFRLRVVMDGGYSVSFAASAIRNILRLLDYQPAILSAVGIVSIAASRSGKRIGDMIAGTMVVRERPLTIANAAAAESAESSGARTVATNVLGDAEFDVLARFVERRGAIPAADRARLATQLAGRFRGRLPEARNTDIVFLMRLYESEALGHGRGTAARGAVGAARERHAIVAEGTPRWTRFAQDLAFAQKRGLKRMTENQVSTFVASYRELSNDLARLRTATRGGDPGHVFLLSRLVAGGHNIIYRGAASPAGQVWRFLAFGVPREVRRSAGPILLSAALFFVPMGIAYKATAGNPAVAPQILPSGMLERAEEGIERARAQKGYIEDPKSARPIMGSMIIANNIQVAFIVFAFGITILGTLYTLVANGVMIGGALGLYRSKGILKLLLAFVAPHSVLELSAITIAGGAGLLIAAGLALPGNRTRREALVENGKRAMYLVTCAILFLLVAGTLEGLVSPIPSWPVSWKVGVGGATLVLMAIYLSLGREKRTTALPEP